MSAIDRNSYKYKQIKRCITIITKTNIKRIFLRGIIGGGLACVGWVCTADTGGYYWVKCAVLADERACGIYTVVPSLV